MIGSSPPRPDGFPKVSGVTRYGDDLVVPGLAYGATLRSPHAHARIRSLSWHAERAPEGAVCVLAKDLSGPNEVALIHKDWPILADGVVRHVGEAVALVVAPTREAARQALEAVEVEYEPLEAVTDLETALDLFREHGSDDDLLAQVDLDPDGAAVDRALEQASRIVESTTRCGHQEHIYIECQAMTAWWEADGTVVVHGSMQCPYYVHKALVHGLGLPEEKVRVRASAVGGGFGGKEDYPSLLALHAALLAQASGRPVRLAYDRQEDIVATTKRHPGLIRHRAAVAEDGSLLAMDIDLTLDGGAYITLSPVVLSRAVLHATGPYRCPAVRIRGRAVRTHTAPNGAFRGFGAPQAQLAAERQMDHIGRAVGVDPLEIRRRNALRPGDRLATGQVMDDSTAALPCLEEAARRTDFQARWRAHEEAREARNGGGDGDLLPGIGLSLYFHGAGFTGKGEHRMRSPVKARLLADGRVEVLTAMTDMGQGCDTIFVQIATEAGGLAPEDLTFAEPDTARVPDSGPTVASRTTMVVGGAIAGAVAELRDQVVGWWRKQQGLAHGLEVEDGVVRAPRGEAARRAETWRFRELARRYHDQVGPLEVTHRHKPPTWQEFDEGSYQGAAYPTYSWGADVVELSVDPDTFETRLDHVTAVCEVGKVIHKTLCAGQIEGGTVQALGWALWEDMKLDAGRYLNDRLTNYIIPTFQDIPPLSVHLLEQPWEGGPFGAKGVGELPMDGGAPAVLCALENATGIVPTAVPALPERLLAWQEEAR